MATKAREADGRPKILVHCCNRSLRELIVRILGKKSEFQVLACEEHGDAFQTARSMAAHVVILDSLDLFLTKVGPEHSRRDFLPVYLLIAMNDDHGDFLAAVRSGARGYVLQEAAATDVVAAIRTVASGQAFCPPGYSRVLFDYIASGAHDLPNSLGQPPSGLTRREQQLIPLIGHGLTNKEIAAHFNLSEPTVKNHVHRILKKTGAANRLALFEASQRANPMKQVGRADAQTPIHGSVESVGVVPHALRR